MVKFITTLDYLNRHKDLSVLKGQQIKVITSSAQMDIMAVQQLMQLQIIPEFVIADENDVEFTAGYLVGRTLQSNYPTVLLTERPLKFPNVMTHPKAFITDDYVKIQNEVEAIETPFQKAVQSGAKTQAPVKKKATQPKAADNENKDVKAKEKEAPVEKQTDKDENVPEKNINGATKDPVKQFMIKNGICDILKKADMDDDKAVERFIYSLQMSSEIIGFEAQLAINILSKEVAEEICSKIKKNKDMYDQLKKLVSNN